QPSGKNIIRWLLKKRTNGSVRYCQYTSQMWDAAVKRAGIRHRKSYQSRHTYACWSLTAGANPAFIANQMGHADAQMVFQVYGKWMSENNNAQVTLLNTLLSEFAPTMPHNEEMKS
uniref:tyrosine-type recombinase/integrase n=1 Tax=Escherichia coli TaxID=562 RepID=UPI002076F173